MKLARLLRHLAATPAGTRRRFPDEVGAALEAAIRAHEARCGAELRFVIETALEVEDLWAGVTPRERALHVFSSLRLWNTEQRSAVLIYVLMADRDVEIVADRAAAAVIPAADWEGACRAMEAEFRAGRFREGALAGIAAVGGLLARHFPVRPGDRDELPNQPVLL